MVAGPCAAQRVDRENAIYHDLRVTKVNIHDWLCGLQRQQLLVYRCSV